MSTTAIGTDRVGEIRDSMLSNPLLIRSELGKPRTRGLLLPEPSFVYGFYYDRSDGGVPEAIGHWRTVERKVADGQLKVKRDFQAMNKAAIKAGLVTADEHYQFRVTHDIGVSLDQKVKNELTLPDIAFGKPPRPSTPMFDLLEHKYQQKWLEEQRLADKAKKKKKLREVKIGKIYETRSSILRKHVTKVEEPPIRPPPHLRKIQSHLDTFRTPEARHAAFKAHWLESAARKGIYGNGIYEYD
uniref:Cilia- and flagella-associated protein 77 n=1 Tax=Callorhinchus milii TaxID=7868 RepID=V9L7F1_CALMI